MCDRSHQPFTSPQTPSTSGGGTSKPASSCDLLLKAVAEAKMIKCQANLEFLGLDYSCPKCGQRARPVLLRTVYVCHCLWELIKSKAVEAPKIPHAAIAPKRLVDPPGRIRFVVDDQT